MGLGRIAHLLAPAPASPPRAGAAPAPAQRSLSAVRARLAAPPAVAAAPRPLSAALARLAAPAAPPVAEEPFACLGTVGGYMVWPDVGTRVRWSEDTRKRHGKVVRHGTREYTGTITRLTLDEMEPRDIDAWARPDGGGRERRVGIGGLRVPKADLPAFVARAEQWFQKRMEAKYGAWPPPPRPAPPPAQAEKRQIANFLIRRAASFAPVWPRPGQTVAAADAKIANVLREEGVAIERAPEVPGQTALEARKVAVRHLQNVAAATKGKPREALFIAANLIEGGMHLGMDEEPAASAPDPRRLPEGLEKPGPARVERAPEATPLSIASARERASIVAYLKREADGAQRGRAQIAAEQLRAIAAEVSTMTMPAADLRAAVIDLLITHALLKTAESLREQMGPTMARLETEARAAVGVEPAGAPRPPEPPPAEAEAATAPREEADSPAPSGARSEPAERRPAKPPSGLNPWEADVLRIAEIEEGKGQRRVAADLRKAIARPGGVPNDQAYRDLLNRVTEMRARHVAMAAESVGDRWEMPPAPTLTAAVGFRAKADRARQLTGGHEAASLFGFLAGRAEEGEEVPTEKLERAEQLLTQAETGDAEARERLLRFLRETRTRALALSAADGKSTAAVLARLARRIERERSPATERTDLLRKASDTLSADMGMRRLFAIERGGRVDLMEQYGRWMNRQAEPKAEPTAAPATPPAPPPRPPFDFSIVLATAKDARGYPRASVLHHGGTPRSLDDAWLAARFRPGERVLTYPSALYHIAKQGDDALLDQARRDVVELEEAAATENRERGLATAGSEAWWQAKMTERGLHALAEARTAREAAVRPPPSARNLAPSRRWGAGQQPAPRASLGRRPGTRTTCATRSSTRGGSNWRRATRIWKPGGWPGSAVRPPRPSVTRKQLDATRRTPLTEAERKAGESRARILSILAEGPASERALLAALDDPTAAHLLSESRPGRGHRGHADRRWLDRLLPAVEAPHPRSAAEHPLGRRAGRRRPRPGSGGRGGAALQGRRSQGGGGLHPGQPAGHGEVREAGGGGGERLEDPCGRGRHRTGQALADPDALVRSRARRLASRASDAGRAPRWGAALHASSAPRVGGPAGTHPPRARRARRAEPHGGERPHLRGARGAARRWRRAGARAAPLAHAVRRRRQGRGPLHRGAQRRVDRRNRGS